MTLNHNFGYFSGVCSGIAGNGSVLCAVWDLMYYTFNLVPKLIKGTKADFTTSAHIAQNTCYMKVGFHAPHFHRSE